MAGGEPVLGAGLPACRRPLLNAHPSSVHIPPGCSGPTLHFHHTLYPYSKYKTMVVSAILLKGHLVYLLAFTDVIAET